MTKIFRTLILQGIIHCLWYSLVLGKVSRCYVCKAGCNDPPGFLQTCPEVNATAWAGDIPIKFCYKYHLDPRTVELNRKSPEKTDITQEDLKHFQRPREYRNCAYQGNVTLSDAHVAEDHYYDVNHKELCKTEKKFKCFYCDTKNGCNNPELKETQKSKDMKGGGVSIFLKAKNNGRKFMILSAYVGVTYATGLFWV